MNNTELTYQEVLNAFDAFGNDLAQVNLGVDLTLYVVRNLENLRIHQKAYQETFQRIFKDFAEEIEDEEGRKREAVPDEKLEEFMNERQELLDKTVEVEYEEISLEDLSEKEREKLDEILTPKILTGIKYTIKDY